MSQQYHLHEVGRLPLPGDNVAIAIRRLDAGTQISNNGDQFTLDYSVLEGHRFAIAPIPAGDELLSWELPFGVANTDIAPGNYVCNESTLKALKGRRIAGKLSLPDAPNFDDRIKPYVIDKATFTPSEQLERYAEPPTFMGYWRSEERGVGTRNDIVLMGTSSQTGSYVRLLAERLNRETIMAEYANIDDIVPLAHTEGAVDNPNNLEITLRTLAGFVTHPNIGAVLMVDYGTETINNETLQAYLSEHGYPLDQAPHAFLTLTGGFQENLAQGEAIVRGWLDIVNATPRTPQSIGHLKLALQCGGSDAFSGISGNPLISWVAREVIRSGGYANLAETDELIGAESYALQKVRDIDTAQKFLDMIERFSQWAENHGTSAEGNPSGGNKYRGLYNITLKSIGAAMKRHPDVRLDGVIDYSEPMPEPGYYFMDSPGNDLESIAGQVASGCNLIFFVTGNGSVTNFSFVPTIKVVTTSTRYRLLSRDMDVNAGAYQDGIPMDDLGADLLQRTINVASGERSIGERAGHSQAQLWRNWQQNDRTRLAELQQGFKANGVPLPIMTTTNGTGTDHEFQAIQVGDNHVTNQIGLVLPTSLCAAQIAGMAANRLNDAGIGLGENISRYVALVHTEGCGSSPEAHKMYIQTILGYLSHPWVKHCLLIEHGCEATHNDYIHEKMQSIGLSTDDFGWSSIQLDGGIDVVLNGAMDFFTQKTAESDSLNYANAGLGALRIGLQNDGPISDAAAASLAQITQRIVSAGGTVVVPENADLLASPAFKSATYGEQIPHPSLAYAQQLMTAEGAGFHIMQTPTEHWVETTVGLGATGVDMIVAYVGTHPMQGHPMLPMLQVSGEDGMNGDDVDLILDGNSNVWADQILAKMVEVAGRDYTPVAMTQGNIDFQVTRGLLGVSL